MKKVKKYGIIERDHRKNYANMNEFPIDIDSRLKEKLLRKVQESSWQKYSIHLESKTIQSLKGLFNIKNLGVIPTQGADGALDILCKAILTPESRVLIPYHTYGQFINFVETMGATILYHGIEKGNLSYKAFVEKNKDSINQLEKYGSIDVVYLPNPHSPLGFIYEEKTILELIKKHKQIKFIIDETYIDFNGKSLINHIHKLKNLIIVRSFSKSYPLAGIRLGAVLYNKENHPLFEPFYDRKALTLMEHIVLQNISSLKQISKKGISFIIKEKKRILRSLNLKYADIHMTKANFIIIESPYAQFIDKYFLSKDLVLRKFNKLFNNFLRYTISDKKTNDLFINLCLECDDYINRNLPRLRNNTSYSCLKKDLFSDESNRESYDETKVSGISKEIIEYATQSRISRLFVIQGGNKILEEELRSHGKNLEILSGKLTSLDKCNFGKIINSLLIQCEREYIFSRREIMKILKLIKELRKNFDIPVEPYMKITRSELIQKLCRDFLENQDEFSDNSLLKVLSKKKKISLGMSIAQKHIIMRDYSVKKIAKLKKDIQNPIFGVLNEILRKTSLASHFKKPVLFIDDSIYRGRTSLVIEYLVKSLRSPNAQAKLLVVHCPDSFKHYKICDYYLNKKGDDLLPPEDRMDLDKTLYVETDELINKIDLEEELYNYENILLESIYNHKLSFSSIRKLIQKYIVYAKKLDSILDKDKKLLTRDEKLLAASLMALGCENDSFKSIMSLHLRHLDNMGFLSWLVTYIPHAFNGYDIRSLYKNEINSLLKEISTLRKNKLWIDFSSFVEKNSLFLNYYLLHLLIKRID